MDRAAPNGDRAVSNRRVDILNRRDAPLHEVESLAPQRRLKTIGDMALDFAPDANRLLADRAVEGQRLLDGMFGCQAAADHLDQRYQMRRIERMSQYYPFGMDSRILEVADQDARRTRRDEAIGGESRGDLCQKIALHVDLFRTVLLDECTARNSARDIGVEAQPAPRGAFGETNLLERRPKPVDERPQPRLGSLRGIARGDIEPFGEEVGGPAGADHARADDGDAAR
jgi:hypothetical protein